MSSALSPSTVQAYIHTSELLMSWKPALSLPATLLMFVILLEICSCSIIYQTLEGHTMNDEGQCELGHPAFVIKKILKGCQSSVPFTPEILRQLLIGLTHTVPHHSLCVLLQSLFLLAFNEFLRLCEIHVAVKSIRDSQCVLQRSDVYVSFEYTNSVVSAVQIIMREYKTNKHNPYSFSYLSSSYSKFPILSC